MEPFTLFRRLILAIFRIISYLVIYGLQALWFVLHGRRDKLGDTIGLLGRAITDALASIFDNDR